MIRDAVWNGVAQWSGATTENDLNEVLPNRQSFCGEGMLFSEADLCELHWDVEVWREGDTYKRD